VKTIGTVALRRDTDKTHRIHLKTNCKDSGRYLDGKTLRRLSEDFKAWKTILVQSDDERESVLKSEGDPNGINVQKWAVYNWALGNW